ncbi:hypothetical protein A2862_01555 [Candidatus Roizmanbacteria bacterium RIFCSPHIGHO2_01_FULL_38_41]|uniref:HD domain-containing protein n=1 Tax=Candidatus Roizmanbacteria bacterium RIFCSPHIGHO2_02_FULL_37_24 TaxID=1802037 RepID=A0A1F7GVH6_9BACT|nr:MAG: hypothetical protein A2862_01555 [Candidatus Roizmanbacteria bacterium RIFCSPHIGHO2_01_FULL_38_41]OGK22891.1 MAG: hypothetical protein A3C24_03435 [Candidatus Roizmanbacteria bacterium RIFCSPHIGHO2_02_FULL_37_24]OGK32446.1 MAG: hypothetical protein A3E10_03940 [Candidatus Roizmanbacteria bacterium RIFCSPHIGHO2_12_FULL_37_23]OGK44621.1 MAG: hypothetical protein A2956_03850 [Candidatus Roizmanbacteria bacterium RIFCSPLOWO2_01_FULL_37_57]
MITKNIMNQIKTHAVHQDWEVAFGGKSRGNSHLFRVNKIVLFLADKEKANKEIAEAGGWLHDIGLIAGNDNDPEAIRKIAEDFLRTLPIEQDQISAISDCVAAHEGDAEAMGIGAQIVHDADVIDKTGMLGMIRHTWKIINLINPEATTKEVLETLTVHLRKRQNNLYTETAKRIARDLDNRTRDVFHQEKKALKLVDSIIQFTKEGLISDIIAQRLSEKSDLVTRKLIQDQLGCGYLD